MLKTNYLIRLDDACPTMKRCSWDLVEALLDKYDVKPMVGIVPDCKDKNLMIDEPNPKFWKKALDWQNKGWAIALHGYDHCYISDRGLYGLNPVWERSEFAGVSLEIQRSKVRNGFGILKENGIDVNYFFAPSHTFDENTLQALLTESEIRIISDTYALNPYKEGGFIYIPCQLGHPKEMKIPGTYTICLHPNTMTDVSIGALEKFLGSHNDKIIAFNDIDVSKVNNISLIDRFVKWIYFKKRGMKK